MKQNDLIKISNPELVYKKFKQLGLDKYTDLYISTRKNKKYMLMNPITEKWVHFGSNLEDYSYHKDERRRKNFLTRNAKWADAEPFSPSFLSYYLLW